MQKVINLYKPLAQTPLQAIRHFMQKYPEYSKQRMAYAGRLDPMAEGVLLVLVGDECKNRDQYQNLDKEYIAELILGVTTDTYDLLGMINNAKRNHLRQGYDDQEKQKERIQNGELSLVIKNFTGEFEQEYPPYSSKTVQGKPLYWWARQNKLDQIELPKKKVEVKSIDLVNKFQISINEFKTQYLSRIDQVQGNFRQAEILKKWQTYLSQVNQLTIFQIKLEVGSGTYVRSLVQEIGKILGVGATTIKIVRNRVGEFQLKDSIRL